MRSIDMQSMGENFGIFKSQNFLFPFIVNLSTEDFCEASMKNCKFYTKQLKKKIICYSHTVVKLKIYLFKCFVVNCPTKLGIMGNCIQVFGLRGVSEFEHAYVVITGHQQCIVGSWLHVHGERAMFRHSAMDTAGKFEHHCLKASVFLDVPNFDDLLDKNIH